MFFLLTGKRIVGLHRSIHIQIIHTPRELVCNQPPLRQPVSAVEGVWVVSAEPQHLVGVVHLGPATGIGVQKAEEVAVGGVF